MQDKNDEMTLAIIEAIVRLEEHVKALSEKLDVLEAISMRLKSIDNKTHDSMRTTGSRAWDD